MPHASILIARRDTHGVGGRYMPVYSGTWGGGGGYIPVAMSDLATVTLARDTCGSFATHETLLVSSNSS